MTPEQSSLFAEQGYLRLPGALPRKQVQPLRDHVFSELKRLNLWAGGKRLSSMYKELSPFQQTLKVSGAVRNDPLRQLPLPEPLVRMIRTLAGTEVAAAPPQLLVSLPNQGEWTLAGLNWHTDASSPIPGRIPGIQAFILIDDVLPHGGATLALAGSHACSTRKDWRDRAAGVLRAGGDVTALGPGLGIVEMAGMAGDVYLMDMRVLHTPSINATARVRIMATTRYLARDFAA